MQKHNGRSIQYILNKFIRKVWKFLWDDYIFLVSIKFDIHLIYFILVKPRIQCFPVHSLPFYFLRLSPHVFIPFFLRRQIFFFLFHEGRTHFLQLGRKIAFLPKYLKAAVKHQILFNVAFCLGFVLEGGSPAFHLANFLIQQLI